MDILYIYRDGNMSLEIAMQKSDFLDITLNIDKNENRFGFCSKDEDPLDEILITAKKKIEKDNMSLSLVVLNSFIRMSLMIKINSNH